MSEQEIAEFRERFLNGMSHAASCVNIVTTDGPAGRAGVTVSAMSSVSADTPKPVLLVCIHHQSPATAKILENGVFCVNVLKDDQSYISDTFAGRFKDTVQDKFDCSEWMPMESGSPRVVDPLVGFDCRMSSSERVGNHHVMFGEVGDIFVAKRGTPLIYANRSYGTTDRIESADGIDKRQSNAENSLTVGCFHTFGPYILPELLQRMNSNLPNVNVGIVEGEHRHIQENLLSGACQIGLLYDFDLSDELELTELTELRPYVLLAESHPLCDKNQISPNDLADYPMVLLDLQPSRDYFMRIMAESGVTPNIAYRSSNFEMVRGMVGHGLGYSLLATKPASPMSYDGRALTSRNLEADVEPSRIVLATRIGANLPEGAKQFQNLCRSFFEVGI